MRANGTWPASWPKAQTKITPANLGLTGRYHLAWGGQWEHLISSRNRLLLVVPLALGLICFLLYLTYGNVIDMIRVFTGVPFGGVGGILALWIRDMPFSISAAVGFMAMSGVAVLDDMIYNGTGIPEKHYEPRFSCCASYGSQRFSSQRSKAASFLPGLNGPQGIEGTAILRYVARRGVGLKPWASSPTR